MRRLLLFLLLTIALAVQGQYNSVVSLTTDDGMSNGSAHCIYQDDLGYIYIGTDVGVDRYDGQRFTHIPYIDDTNEEKGDVTCIIGETDQSLLVGCQRGLWRLDLRTLTMRRIFAKEMNFAVETAVKTMDGTVYVATANGLYSINGHQVKAISLSQARQIQGRYVVGLALGKEGRQGSLWVALRKGLLCIDLKSGRLTHEITIYNSPDKRTLTSLAVSTTGRILVGTSADGILEYTPSAKLFSNYYFAGCQIKQLTCTPDNHLLVATGYHGAFDISLRDNQIVRSYTTNDVISVGATRFDSPETFYRDKRGTDWIGYKFFGIDYMHYNRHTFHVWRVPGLFDSSKVNVRSFLRDGQRTLLGTRHGLYVVDENVRKVHYLGPDLLNASIVSAIKRVGNSYFVGTINGGLHLLDVQTLRDVTPAALQNELRGSNVYELTCDKDGNLWACTTSGLLRYQPTDGRHHLFTTANSQLPDNEVMSIGFDGKGNGWVSTYHGGISFYHGGQGMLFGKHQMPSRAATLSAPVWILPWDNTHMLFTMLKGRPVVYDTTTDEMEEQVTEIPFDSPRSQYFRKLRDGSVIYGTKHGLYAIRKNDLRAFGYIDGLPNMDFQSHGYAVEGDSMLWVATNGGLAYASIGDLLRTDYETLPIVLSDIITDHIFDVEENNEVNSTGLLRLSRHKNEFAVKFSPLVYGRMGGVVYYYKLEGYDDDWQMAGSDRSIFYGSLSPGSYRLLIKAPGLPEVHTTIDVDVPLTYSAMLWLLLIVLVSLLVGHIVYCKVRKREYFWERLLPKPGKYQTSRMDKREADRLVKALKTYMDEQKPYRRSDLTMADLAKAIGCSSHTLSQLFSQHLNRNYYDFIAEYRINEFKRLATDPKYSSLTITALAEKCGFASRNPFLTSFKKFTGMTPKDYMKSIQK